MAELTFVDGSRHGLLYGFAFFAADLLAGIANSFALVGLRRIVSANIGGGLADDVLIDAFDADLGVIRHGDFHFRGDVEQNGMRFAEAEVELLALDGGFETDALN